jgi:hypothetical protein
MYSVHRDKDLIQVFVYGKLDEKELFDAQMHLMIQPDYLHKNSIWIFDETFDSDYSETKELKLINQIKRYFPTGATKKKAALLTKSSKHFPMMQTFSEKAKKEGVQFTFKAFKRYKEAMDWLTGLLVLGWFC